MPPTSPAHPARAAVLVPLALLIAYAGLHIAARLVASGNLAEMDPAIEVQARAWALAYVPGEAPLYTWIIRAVEMLTGPGLLAFQLVKYACVTATGLGLWAVARRLTEGDTLWSLLAVEALALIYQLSWRLHEGFAGELLAFVAAPLVVLQVVRIAETRRPADYLGLGLAAALAIEATGPARIWLAAVLVAALLQPHFRRALLRPPLALAALIALPAAAHLIAITPDLFDGLTGAAGSPKAWFDAVIAAPVLFLSPHVLILAALFPAMLPALLRRLPADDPAAPTDRLIADASLLALLALALGVTFGIGFDADMPVQWVGPMFLIVSTWATGRARRAARQPWQTRALVTLGLALAAIAFGLRLANMYWQQPVCKICRWGVPYAALADRLAAERPAAILAADNDTAGNLIRFFPHLPVGSDLARRDQLPRPLVIVWTDKRPPAERAPFIAAGGGVATTRVPWPAGLIARPDRATSVWHSVTLP